MEFGILVCTHSGHRRFSKSVLESLKKTNPKVLLVAYDYPFAQKPPFPLETTLPASDVMGLADAWFFNEIIFAPGSGVGPSWMKQQFYGIELLKKMGMKYIISINGDCIFTKPEGADSIFKMLTEDDGDLISCHYTEDKGLGTMCYFSKIDVAVKIASYIMECSYSRPGAIPESLFGIARNLNNFKCIPVENQESIHFSYGVKGTFFNSLGLRHLHGTEKWRIGNHHKPLPRYFYDERYLPPDQLRALNYFWKTGKTDKLIEFRYWNKNPGHPGMAEKFAEEI